MQSDACRLEGCTAACTAVHISTGRIVAENMEDCEVRVNSIPYTLLNINAEEPQAHHACVTRPIGLPHIYGIYTLLHAVIMIAITEEVYRQRCAT